MANYLEGFNTQLNCNRCGFKTHIENMKIEKIKSKIKPKSKCQKFLKEEINEVSNT